MVRGRLQMMVRMKEAIEEKRRAGMPASLPVAKTQPCCALSSVPYHCQVLLPDTALVSCADWCTSGIAYSGDCGGLTRPAKRTSQRREDDGDALEMPCIVAFAPRPEDVVVFCVVCGCDGKNTIRWLFLKFFVSLVELLLLGFVSLRIYSDHTL